MFQNFSDSSLSKLQYFIFIEMFFYVISVPGTFGSVMIRQDDQTGHFSSAVFN